MRNPSVSIAKGIAIILMVTAHAGCGIWWQCYINMFHMPLFLFMSGYCFKEAYLADVKGFATKKIKGIWWPFVKWQLLFLLLHNIFFSLNIYNSEYGYRGEVSHKYGIEEILKNAFCIITVMSHGEQLLGGYWFLKTLFVGSILFYLAMKIVSFVYNKSGEEKKFNFCVGIILLTIMLLFGFIDRNIPFVSIGTKDFMSGFFIYCGYLYSKNNLQIDKHWWFIVTSIILVAIGNEFWQVTMPTMKFKLIIPYIFTALLGTLTVFGISSRLSSYNNILKRFLTFAGDNTLDILTWHFLSFKLVSLLLIWFYGLNINILAEFPVIEKYSSYGWWMLYLVVGVAVPLFISFLKRKR